MTISLARLTDTTFSLAIERGGAARSWASVTRGLVEEAALREELSLALVDLPFSALFWEARPVSQDDSDAPFESVAIEAPSLALARADASSFAGPLAGAKAPEVRCFANLSGDADLVVPAPGDGLDYSHLKAFLLRAPGEQRHALWQAVGEAALRRLEGPGRLWLGTAGLGVPWLHVRLDRRPKYVKWPLYRGAGGDPAAER